MAKTFGQPAADYEETRGAAETDEVWIRNFKNPNTRIRICPARGVNKHGKEIEGTDAWPHEWEHYEPSVGSFPCDESPTCPGCTDPDEKVRKRSGKYYFNALDEKGYVRVYKIGVKFYRVMQNREQRLGTLSDRDYFVNKFGTGLDTTYELESGEKYDVDFEQVPLHDIQAIITARYNAAVAAYNGEDAGAAAADDTPREERIGVPETPTRIVPASASTERITPAKAEPQDDAPQSSPSWSETGSQAAEHKETPPSQLPDWGPNPTEEQINNAETGVIKLWLDSMEVEYPSRAPRQRLIKAAVDKSAEPPY